MLTMINPFPRAKELYEDHVANSVTQDMKPDWEHLSAAEKGHWINEALKEHYDD